MSERIADPTETPAGTTPTAATARTRLAHRVPPSLSFGRIGAVYLWVATVVLFSVWKPDIFPQYATVTSVLNSSAISGLLGLALIVPLAAGVFDLSVGFTLGMGCVLTANLLRAGHSVTATIILVLLASLVVGAVNAVVVVVIEIDSFIGTLATGSLLQAVIIGVSGNQQITSHVDKLQSVMSKNLHDITLPVFVFFIVALVLWVVLEHTVTGRFIYATGLGKEQARLAGIRVKRLQFGAFLVSGLISGGAGMMLTGIVGGGSPDIGPPYLIPAFAAAFLGATQLKDGLFNSLGTVMAVLLLGTITEGLALATSSLWAPYVFNGLVLIAALGLRVIQEKRDARKKVAAATS
jgi:ribose transport system permease protein